MLCSEDFDLGQFESVALSLVPSSFTIFGSDEFRPIVIGQSHA
jgi:hypothetical protein